MKKRRSQLLNLPLYIFLFVPVILASCKEQNELSQTIVETDNQQDDVLDSSANLIYQDSHNNYWFASRSAGVYRMKDSVITHFTAEDGILDYHALSIQEDKLGNLFFDTPNGVFIYDGTTFKKLEVTQKNDWQLNPDDLWFRMGWEQSGPLRYDGKKLYQLTLPKNELEKEFRDKYGDVPFNPYGVYSIYKDGTGAIWIGTSSLGLYRYDGKKVQWMYEEHLMITPQGGAFGFRSVIEDKDGYIWINNPTYKYKVEENSDDAAKGEKITYTRETGIEEPSIDSTYFMSATLDKNGALWMCSYNQGIFRYEGNEFTIYPLNKDIEEVTAFSIYCDNFGKIWVYSHNDGAYKFNGKGFEKYRWGN